MKNKKTNSYYEDFIAFIITILVGYAVADEIAKQLPKELKIDYRKILIEIIMFALIFIAVLLLFIIIATPLVNAYYPGENICIEHNLGTDHLVYTIIDNVTSIVEPIVTFNSTHINITFPTNMPPQSYTIVFLEETTNEIIVEVPVYSSGGGGTRTKYVDKEIITEIPNYITQYEYINNETIAWIDGGVLEKEDHTKIHIIAFIIFLIIIIVAYYFIGRNLRSSINLESSNEFGEDIELEGGKEYE